MDGYNGVRRCIPPIRWLSKVFVPPRDSDDWTLVSYQPMLYLCAFCAALVILIFGDFTNIPAHLGIDEDRQFGIFWVWGGLSLVCPLLALGSLWLIKNHSGAARYRGFWLRLAADFGQLAAMLIYVVLRLTWGDYHIYPVAMLISATLFVFHLVMRDVHRLVQVERIAAEIRKDGR